VAPELRNRQRLVLEPAARPAVPAPDADQLAAVLCWDVHTFLVPVLGHERGLSATVIGSILGAFALAATAIRLVMPWLAASTCASAVVIGSAMVAPPAVRDLPAGAGGLAMGVLSVLLGVALGSVQPMIMSTLHQITPKHRHGEALGLRAMAINGSSVVMPLLFGSAGVLVGVSGVFWSGGLVVGAGSRLAWTHACGRLARLPPRSDSLERCHGLANESCRTF
jgi:hypothetical protein